MTKKKKMTHQFDSPEVEPERFTSGQVSRLLGTPVWRLHRFLAEQDLRLSQMQLGSGRGSRMLFNFSDLCRISLVSQLIQDGLAPRFAAQFISSLNAKTVQAVDEEGNSIEVGLYLKRTGGSPQVHVYTPGHEARALVDHGYYFLNVSEKVSAILGAVKDLKSGLKRIKKARANGTKETR